MQQTSIRWIAFDAVGTLIFPDPPVHLAYYRVGQRYGSRLSPAEVRSGFERAFAEHGRSFEWSGNGETGEREFWRRVVAAVLPDVEGPEACFEELYAHFARPDAWQCFADVDECLSELVSRGYGLAIASNFDSRLHGVCDGIPELAGIGVRVISSEVGAGKPDPRFYDAVLSACGCRADELLIVGDDGERDVAGPRRAGIAAWGLSRGGEGEPDCLRSLSDLVDRLPSQCGAG